MKRLPPAVPALRAPARALAAVRAESAARIRSATLANGLRVIVWPSASIPNVVINNWVRVGSRNEVPGLTGLAHFFEHMMFNGSAGFGPGEFDRLVESSGGASNAFTTDDVTVYQTWIPRAALELALSLEADRIARLTFDPAIVERERRVVRSERRLCVDDNPAALLSERVQAAAFVAHPYRFPTIGLPEDIGSWRLGDLRKFYRAYYAPGNQTFVIAGDVEADRALALARKLLEPIAPREPPPEVRTREPRQLGERRVVIERKGHTPLLQYAYKAPAASDRRAPALRLLLAVLVEGDASRLHRRLVEDRKIAVEVSGDWHEGFDPALFWLHLMLPEGADMAMARRALDAELSRIVEEGITAAELERAKSLNAVQHFRQLATLDGKAHLLGEYEVLRGGWRALLDAPQRLDAVTRAEVQAVAREVLDPRRRCSGVLEPTRHGRRA